MVESVATLAVKLLCILSAVLAFATPLQKLSQTAFGFTATSEIHLAKTCTAAAGVSQCVNYDGKQNDIFKASLAFTALALVASVVATALHFKAPVDHQHAMILSGITSFCFLVSFATVADGKGPVKGQAVSGYDFFVGFAFQVIGFIAGAFNVFLTRGEAANKSESG